MQSNSDTSVQRKRRCDKCGKSIVLNAGGSLGSWLFRPADCQCERTRRNDSAGVGREPLPEATVVDSRYLIQEFVGSTDVIEVYRALHLELDRNVVLQVLTTDEPAVINRFRMQLKRLGKLRSSHLIDLFDVSSIADRPYAVFELFEGITLSEYVEEYGPLCAGDAIELFWQCTEGLEEAHRLGVVHGGITPSNILVSVQGKTILKAKIADLGLGSVYSLYDSHSVEPAASSPYTSPEQKLGHVPDHRSDIYALAAVVRRLTSSTEPSELEEQFDRGEILSTSEFQSILSQSLQERPEKRFASVTALRTSLRTKRRSRNTKFFRGWFRLLLFGALAVACVRELLGTFT